MTAPTGTPAAAEPAGSGSEVAPVDLLVDWRLAARTAAQLAGPGPQISAEAAARSVAGLREAARAAQPHVAEVSRLVATGGGEVMVVDRAGWARNNATSFRSLLEPVVAQAFSRRDRLPSGATAAVGSRVTGTQVGALLGFLAGRVLGQYDPFAPDGGRLLLVAPNVVQVQRELDVQDGDFALWVCLHEEAHRVQFAATPWLAEHLRSRLHDSVGGLLGDPDRIADRLAGLARGVTEALRTARDPDAAPDDGLPPLMAALTTPEQREQLARITAVMSLLEGHADVVMDDVGPRVVPTVATIRERFTKRRAGRGSVDRLVRRLLGLEAKLRQYADGARFVRGVHEAVGVDGLNAVWTSPQTLPLPAEIADPAAWVRRVHG